MGARSTGGRAVAVGRTVVGIVRNEEVTFLAAGIAYYAFVSVLPALLLAVAVASAVGGEAFAGRVTAASGGFLTPAGQEVVTDALVSAEGRTGATIAGTGLLLWSTLRVFRGLDIAFSAVYGLGGRESVLVQVRDAIVVLGAITIGIGAMTAVGGALALLDLPVAADALGLGLLLAGLTLSFLPMYYVFPDVRVTVREALPGAALTAVGWVILQALFQVYAAAAPRYDLYGVVGGVLLVVTWFYVAAALLLVGAALNAVLAGRDGSTNRQGQDPGRRHDRTPDMAGGDDADTSGLREDVRDLREDLDAVEERIEERTVDRSALEADLRRYVRSRLRRGHARGWGPYVVLLYGTAMTIGAFYFLSGGWAILAMIVVWLSTLGLYALMVLVGVGVGALGLPGKAVDAVRDWRS